MSEQAIRYFRENKGKYPEAVLEKTLLDAGYAPADVAASKKEAYPQGGNLFGFSASPTSFLNFKDRKRYVTAGEKWADFFLGGFAPAIWIIFIEMFDNALYLSNDGEMFFYFIGFVGGLISLFYFWNRRRNISVGLLCSFFLSPFFLALISETLGFNF